MILRKTETKGKKAAPGEFEGCSYFYFKAINNSFLSCIEYPIPI